MKRLLIAALAGFILSSCSDTKKQEKDALDSVIAIHDKVMGSDELLMKNKMQLDTLLKLKTPDSVEIKGLSEKLNVAEDAMEDWMHKFDPDVTGKSHEQVMTYFTDQKKQIIKVDSMLNAAVAGSDSYLQKHKRK